MTPYDDEFNYPGLFVRVCRRAAESTPPCPDALAWILGHKDSVAEQRRVKASCLRPFQPRMFRLCHVMCNVTFYGKNCYTTSFVTEEYIDIPYNLLCLYVKFYFSIFLIIFFYNISMFLSYDNCIVIFAVKLSPRKLT